MPTAPAKSGRTCPNCNTFVPAERRTCGSCKLAVERMDGFLAAKTAAQKRGFSGGVDTGETPAWRSPGTIIKVVLLLAVIAGVAYLFRPRPPRYMAFPDTAEGAARALLTHISGGETPDLDQAYSLVPDSSRSKNNDDEKADYEQIYDVMNNYFAGEFGTDWVTQTKFSADPADPNIIIAQVSLQTVHIHTADQVPADKKSTQGSHYGVTGIDEFSIGWAADFRQGAGINGALHALTGSEAAGDLLNKVTSSFESNRNGPPMVKKIHLLSAIRDPHNTIYRNVVQAYPFRDDPVMRNRLQMITKDDRYDSKCQEIAQKILDDKLDEEYKIDGNVE